jgi:hypothetical protein
MLLWFKCERINQSAIYKNKNTKEINFPTRLLGIFDLAQNKGGKISPVTSPAFDLAGHNIRVTG